MNLLEKKKSGFTSNVFDEEDKFIVIKPRPLSTGLSNILCNEMGNTHKLLLLHTKIL